MKTDPNDLAFRNVAQTWADGTTEFGLTKREYFAALAMQAIVSTFQNGKLPDDTAKLTARGSCIFADALIEALNKEING